ncbi:MerR family transcriptional regulator [Paraflavitalea soli]|uniref:MerR family transcriptional regulator n=1 Tax=Paraflavitalea soli TaxID=2315862 RepID=A0A3B7MNT6_9BACT|nr:MerR family transcriptional regulator [Paraflavitalea soli]AXY76184.1 MerR family transcriptional regulator [Paraflavitalea soli]
MKLYHISELEQLSGIKAPTIRVWERRYNLIEPGRTDTNIRMYDDRQVRKLLNVATLLSNGYKISKIAELDEDDMHAMVLGLQGSTDDADSVATSFVNELIVSMLAFDEVNFEKTFAAAASRYGLFEAMLNVFYPLLHKIGIMWSTEDAMPVQEHFASAVVRRKLIAATDALVLKRKRRKKFLLMLPPGEWHEIGLLFANYIIRAKEVETIYLGQNVPYEQVPAVLEKTELTHVLLFFIARPEQDNLTYIRKAMQLPRDLPLLVAGSHKAIAALHLGSNTHLLESPHDLLNYL